jgi:predicted NodU family carbamoyl transferase
MRPARGSPVTTAVRHRAFVKLPFVLVLVALVAVACGGKDKSAATYTANEVVAAFADNGFTLAKVKDSSPQAGKQTVLAPNRTEQFAVLVATNAAAADTWHQYELQGPDADSLDLKRANVLVLSDGGLTASQRRAVQKAVAALPDRGDDVETIQAS